MLRSYLIGVSRYISRNKVFSTINILGLAIGMTACMLISQYVIHEYSYDNYLDRKEHIFRLQLDRYNKGEISTRWASGAAGIGPDLKTNFPEVERYVRMRRENVVMSNDEAVFKESNVWMASEEFFRMFSIRLISGTDSLVLKDPFKIVLSQSMAKKYFGSEDPIGRTIKSNGKNDFEVTGVFEDLPANTHMQIDALMSFETLKKMWNDPIMSWQWDAFMTYIELNNKTDYKTFEAKLPAFVHQKEGETLKRADADMIFHLQKVTDIHLDSDFMFEYKPNGDRQSTNFLTIVAALILIIAWINYVNLSSAKSIERAREVGVRKVMGSFKTQLMQQFLFESILMNICAAIIALGSTFLITPWFGGLVHRDLGYTLFQMPVFWLAALSFVLIGSLLSGLYPAFILSAYRPIDVLKSRFRNSRQGLVFRKGMVIVQFTASVTLIIGTFTVYHQIEFMRSQKLGINLDQTLLLNSPNVVDSTYLSKYRIFKQRILQYTEVVSVCASTSIPGRQPEWNAGGIRLLSQREDEANQYRIVMMDNQFIDLYGLEIKSGRKFNDEISHEYENVLLNESAVRQMGFSKPDESLNEQIFFWGDTFKIVGVVKDYHQESLKKAFEPLIFRYNEAPGGYYSIRFKTSDVKSSMSRFEADWKELFPGNPFISFFLDDHYNQQYQADQQFGEIFGIFSAFAIFIACLGLFGLSSLTAIQRTKEIGVRKVLGATVPGILTLVSRDYMVLLLIAIAPAIPISFWIMNEWLTDFANRIELSWWLFVLPSLLVIAIAFATILIHTLRAARTNPAKSLRYE